MKIFLDTKCEIYTYVFETYISLLAYYSFERKTEKTWWLYAKKTSKTWHYLKQNFGIYSTINFTWNFPPFLPVFAGLPLRHRHRQWQWHIYPHLLLHTHVHVLQKWLLFSGPHALLGKLSIIVDPVLLCLTKNVCEVKEFLGGFSLFLYAFFSQPRDICHVLYILLLCIIFG